MDVVHGNLGYRLFKEQKIPHAHGKQGLPPTPLRMFFGKTLVNDLSRNVFFLKAYQIREFRIFKLGFLGK